MALVDDKLNRLFEAAVVARRRYVATGLADALLSVTDVEAATICELAAADAAQAASRAADEELADYKAAKLWGTLTKDAV